MANMRSEFESILRQYGHDIFLQRRTQNTSGLPTYSDTLERHTVRFSVTATRTIPKTQAEQMEGITNTSERIYYFKNDANPYEGDRIYESDLRNEENKTVWVIDQAIPMRGLGGNIVYWYAGATRIKPN